MALVHSAVYVPLAILVSPVLVYLARGELDILRILTTFTVVTTCITVTAIVGLFMFQSYVNSLEPGALPSERLWRFGKVVRSREHVRPAPVMLLQSEGAYVHRLEREIRRTVRSSLKAEMAQMPSWAGLQVHRSYWASYDMVRRLRYRNGNPVLELTSDTEIPVSRHRVSEVRRFLDLRDSRQ